MVAKPPEPNPRTARAEASDEQVHRHEWVVHLTTGRVARRECPRCTSERTAQAELEALREANAHFRR